MDSPKGSAQSIIAKAALDAKNIAAAKNAGAMGSENAAAMSGASGSRGSKSDGKEDSGSPIYAPASYSVKGAVEATGLGRAKIYIAINSGALRAKKLGKRTVIIDSDLRAWLASLPDYVPGQVAVADAA